MEEDSSVMEEALSNPVIGDIVGGFLSEDDLKACRSVCHNWYKRSSSPFRKKATLFIRNLNDLYKLVLHPDETYQSSPHKRICFMIKKLEGVKIARTLAEFWSVHSEGVTSMTIKNVETCDWEIFLDLIHRRAPNLTTLVILNSFSLTAEADLMRNFEDPSIAPVALKLIRLQLVGHFDNTVHDEILVKLLKWLLRSAPNIKALHLADFFHTIRYNDDSKLTGYYYLEQVLSDLIELRRNDPSKCCLETLDIAIATASDQRLIATPIIKTLEMLQFPLETLTMDFGDQISAENAASILENHKTTLKKLAAYGTLLAQELYRKFSFGVHLPKLQVLRISHCLLESMDFLTLLPALEVLHVSGARDKIGFIENTKDHYYPKTFVRNTQRNRNSGLTNVRLKEFRIEYLKNVHEASRLRLWEWMPKVGSK